MFTDTILSLDLATVTGFAYGKPGSIPQFGSIRFSPPGSPRPVTYRRLRSWLNGSIEKIKPGIVIFESAAIPMVMQGRTNADTIKLLMGMCEHVEELCYERVDLREATTSEVRAHFLGTNRIKRDEAKAMTMDKCRQLGVDVTNDNEGDAVALWFYQVHHLRPDLAVKHTPLFMR